MTNAPRGLDAGRRAYQAHRNRHRKPEPVQVVTDLGALRDGDQSELGRTRYAADKGDTAAQAALRIFDVQRDAATRAKYRAPATGELDDDALAGIARATLDDIETRRKNVSPSPDAS